MSERPGVSPTLVFRARPKAVPGDLRVSWRLSMTLLALYYSRGKRASLIKLNILNGAIRFDTARDRLIEFLGGNQGVETCTVCVEPAFSRSLDLLVGKGLAQWVKVANKRLGVQMTPQGLKTAAALDASVDLFKEEKNFLATTGRRVTEQIVRNIVSAGGRWQI